MFDRIKGDYPHAKENDETGEYRFWAIKDYLDCDPFLAHPFDNHARSHPLDTAGRYSKKSFTQHLVKLIDNDIHKPDSLLKIADAMYNMTYFGNSWILVRNSWSAFDNVYGASSYHALDNVMSPKYYNYYSCRMARDCYQRAFDATTDKEIKAKALLMMAQCDKNFAYMLRPGKKPANQSLFDRFARDYKDTRYYADLSSECDVKEMKWQFYRFIP